MNTKYTVIGAGHGGKAMAAHLALMGFPVTLWNRSFEHIEVIKKARWDRARKHRKWGTRLWKIYPGDFRYGGSA